MSRLISRAESWEKVYLAMQNINFAAFDYNTIKRSIIDYIKLYFPETFNDYIESSEFIAIVEVFAYIGELLAYRLDVNAHENFISTAQRRESLLRLAKLISYKPDRPVPVRGLVKITSISTTEPVVDANGVNLSNVVVRWNDSTNLGWKDQFLLIMNRVLDQQFGNVAPTDRFQVNNVLFELYNWNSTPLANGVFSYNVLVDGRNVPMELVPAAYTEQFGITERRPERNSRFVILYGNDGLGDSSDTTGFFCYTKQGTLFRYTTSFDGITPNQSYDVGITEINETDVWLNHIDPDTGEVINNPDEFAIYRKSLNVRTGEWQEVDSLYENIIFNTNAFRNKYEVETLDGNDIRLIFGDGEFATIPKGTFDVWVRTSLNEDLVISRNAIVDQSLSFTYVDDFGRIQTFTFTFSLINSLQNGSSAETNEHIRVTAPSTYATQNRMVSAEDYNNFMLQDSSIVKMRAVNRTFAGDSKYISWNDPSENYANVKMFSDDGIIYFYDREVSQTTNVVNYTQLILSFIQPLLSSTDIFLQLTSNGVSPTNIRKLFTQDENQDIIDALTPPPTPSDVQIFFRLEDSGWYPVKVFGGIPNISLIPLTISQIVNYGGSIVGTNSTGLNPLTTYTSEIIINGISYPISVLGSQISTYNSLVAYLNTILVDVAEVEIFQGNIRIKVLPTREISTIVINDTDLFSSVSGWVSINSPVQKTFAEEYITYPLISVIQINIFENRFIVSRSARRMIFESNTTRFWNVNAPNAVIDYDTLNSDFDRIVLLKANVNSNRTGILTQNWTFDVLSQQAIDSGTQIGLPNIHQLNIISSDQNQDKIPDNLTLEGIINPVVVYNVPSPGGLPVAPFTPFTINLPIYYVSGFKDVSVEGNISGVLEFGVDWTETPDANGISNTINLIKTPNVDSNNTITIKIKDYVYFSRLSQTEQYQPVETSYENIEQYLQDQINNTGLWKRHNGRDGLNFGWFHNTPRYNLVDPAATNIIDMFVLTKGYYTQFQRYLMNPFATEPLPPTPLELRTTYNYLLKNKMISDTVILHPIKFKLLFGPRAQPELQATFKIIKSENSILADNQIKSIVVNEIQRFFEVEQWEFGETFYFTELSAAIHTRLPNDISSVVLVPTYQQNQFGDLFQVLCREDEIFYVDINTNMIDIVISYNSINLRQNPQ
jgi:hypothetical protein